MKSIEDKKVIVNINNSSEVQIEKLDGGSSILEEQSQKMIENNLYLTEAIAYYNLAASYEHIQQMKDALKAYLIANEIARKHLGPDNHLTTIIAENLKKF